MSNNLELKVVFSAIDKFIKPVKAITEGASKAAKAFRENNERLKELNRTVERLDAFKKASADAAITANAFSKNKRAIDALQASIDKVGVPTKAMAKEMAELSKRSAELKAKHESLVSTEQRLFEKLKADGVNTAKLAEERMRLSSASAAATNASRALGQALEAENQKMRRLRASQAELEKSRALGGKLTSAGGKMIAAGAVVNAAAAVPVMAYAKAEDSATQLKISMMQRGGQVAAEFDQVNKLAMRLGNKLPGTTSDYQDMMTMLIRQGMPAKNILGGLGEATAYLAVQLKMAPTAAAEFASKLQDATRTADKDMMGLMDTIQKTFYLGVDQNNMLQGFAKLSPALSIIKKEGKAAADELAPLLVLADQSGMAGEAAGNAYRKIFQGSLDKKKLGKGNAALAGTGVKLDFSNGAGEFGGLDKMYAQLEQLRKVNTSQRLAALKAIFGDDAETLQALTLMIERGAQGYRDVQAKLQAQAEIQQRVNAQLGTLRSLWDAASGTFTNVLVSFGESIAPELHASAEWIGKLTERMQAWSAENPALSATLMHFVKWLGLTLVVLGGLAATIGSGIIAVGTFRFALASIGMSAGPLIARLWAILGPIGKVIAAFEVGYAAGSLLNDKINQIVSSMLGYDESLGGAIYDLVQKIKSGFDSAVTWVTALPDRMMQAGRNMIDGFIAGIESRFGALKQQVDSVGNASVDWLKNKLGIHSPSRVFAQLGEWTMQGFEQGLAGGEGGPLDQIRNTAKKVAGIGAGIVIAGASGGAAAGQGASNKYEIHIHAAPGMDENAIAQIVVRKIDEYERAKTLRAQRSLRDRD